MRQKSTQLRLGKITSTDSSRDDVSDPYEEAAKKDPEMSSSISKSLKKQGKDNKILGQKIGNYINNLTAKVSRGNYIDGVPTEFIHALGRQDKWWIKLPVELKQSYLRGMVFIVKDKPEDYYLGDAKFHNLIIAGRASFLNSMGIVMSKDYLESDVVDFPDALNNKIETSKSNFEYAKLLNVLGRYVRKIKDPKSRARRYDAEGNPLILPISKRAWHYTFRQFDQFAEGMEKAMLLSPHEQEALLIEALIPKANQGWPLFKPCLKQYAVKDLIRACQVINYKLELEHDDYDDKDHVTINTVLRMVKFFIKGKLHFPYVLFYRTQGGEGETKHRCVFGAYYYQKWIAALFSVAKIYGYEIKPDDSFEDEVFDDKHIFSVGGLPIVMQTNWDKLFTAIKKRLPSGKMSQAKIKQLFDYDLPPGDYEVDVIVNDFPSFDTGMIAEDMSLARKHKKLGWLFAWVLDDLIEGEVWTGNKVVEDVIWKSGFFGTSDFGSAVNRNAVYAACEYYKAQGVDCHVLAATFLADDSCIYVINLTSKMIDEFLSKYGLGIKADESMSFNKDGFVEVLKVFVGKIFKDSTDNTVEDENGDVTGNYNILGDPMSRYYGLAHQEREIEQELGSDDFRADTRGIWRVTGLVEVDALLSKLASFGDEGGPLVRVILETVKDTDLGQKAILAISRMKSKHGYKPYRADLEISFPPDWLADLEVQDLIIRREELS